MGEREDGPSRIRNTHTSLGGGQELFGPWGALRVDCEQQGRWDTAWQEKGREKEAERGPDFVVTSSRRSWAGQVFDSLSRPQDKTHGDPEGKGESGGKKGRGLKHTAMEGELTRGDEPTTQHTDDVL